MSIYGIKLYHVSGHQWHSHTMYKTKDQAIAHAQERVKEFDENEISYEIFMFNLIEE